jgi:hypothetical protein
MIIRKMEVAYDHRGIGISSQGIFDEMQGLLYK